MYSSMRLNRSLMAGAATIGLVAALAAFPGQARAQGADEASEASGGGLKVIVVTA